jgi:hypothetical protein
MIKHPQKRTVAAFTRPDLMVGVFLVVIMAMLFLPTLANRNSHRPHYVINCAYNLMNLGLAFKLWAGDNNDKYPQQCAGSTS